MVASRKNEPIIKVKHLSKQYNIGVDKTYKTLCDSLTSALRNPLEMLKGSQNPNNTFWALKDVNFEVEQGEILGIIGRNGAGKSTLLKVISRITYPTKGEVRLRGRVGSLLEVGTGFHPELTGRENIYFNGAILGMKKREIDEKFDEIVKFAEVENFLDTPVKRYSSGMYTRLAFAVAAHMDPEILIVDEVLAVGDVAFQKRCLGKMKDVATEGRTVLLVSHQMGTIRSISTRCLLLDSGRIVDIGSPSDVISNYLKIGASDNTNPAAEWNYLSRCDGEKAKPYFIINRFALTDEEDRTLPSVIDQMESAFILIEGYADHIDKRLCIGFHLFDDQNNSLMMSYQTDQPEENWPTINSPGNIKIRAKLDLNILNEGKYRAVFVCSLHCIKYFYNIDQTDISFSFEIIGNRSGSPYWTGRRDTLIAPALKWELIE